MNASSTPLRPKKPFGCGFVVFPIVLIGLGLAFVSAGRQLAPQSNADAAAFRSDPSCAPDLTVRAPRGACTTIDATVVGADVRQSGTGKTPVRTPFAVLRFADGTFHEVELDAGTGEVFVYSVASGARARVQLFRGNVVRITAGTDNAETVAAPDVDAANVGQMPWVGAVAIVAAILIFGARVYVTRRTVTRKSPL
jgi:hypothetical protein